MRNTDFGTKFPAHANRGFEASARGASLAPTFVHRLPCAYLLTCCSSRKEMDFGTFIASGLDQGTTIQDAPTAAEIIAMGKALLQW